MCVKSLLVEDIQYPETSFEPTDFAYDRIVFMMLDGMREDFFSGPQATANFSYEGYKATFIEEMMKDHPDHCRYYSVTTDVPTLTFQ